MNKKKLWGALLSGLSVIIYYSFILILVFSDGFTFDNSMPKSLVSILLIIIGIPLLGVTIALISRIRELKGGEEEEAKKY